MLKSMLVATGGAFALLASAATAPAIAAEGASCRSGQPSMVVSVGGFRSRTGTVEVKLYGNNRATFLEKGRYLARKEVRVPGSGRANVCVPVPAQGSYAVSVRHVIGASKSNSDGGGMSRNPRMSLTSLISRTKPSLSSVLVPVGSNPVTVPVLLNYRQGLSFGPVKNPA